MASPTTKTTPKTVLITGANGYIGNAVARAFVRAGSDWLVYGLIRSASSRAISALAAEEITPIIGAIDDRSAHEAIIAQLPPRGVDVVISTTESWPDYEGHYHNVVALLRLIAESKPSSLTSLTTGGGGTDGSGIQVGGGNTKTKTKTGKPLLIFTSGCKDYGADPTHLLSSSSSSGIILHPHPHPQPHTEETPLSSLSILRPRTQLSSQIFDRLGDLYATVLVRPINLYGRSGSFFREWFDVFSAAAAAAATEGRQVLVVPSRSGEGREICQGLHVDDCAEAYVALATEHFVRDDKREREQEEEVEEGEGDVAGEAFNISSQGREETVDGIVRALCEEYGVGYERVRYVKPEDLKDGENPWPSQLVVDWPQLVGDGKLRRVTGWRDRRPLFKEAIGVYRRAYEAAKEEGGKGWENAKKAEETVKALGDR